MVALSTTASYESRRFSRLSWVRLSFKDMSLVGAIALASLATVTGTILLRGFSDNGFRLGSQMGWRFASFVFFAALVAGPVGRLLARMVPAAIVIAQSSRSLFWGFCASYAVYLAAILLPNAIQLSGGATLFVLFGAAVTLVMALTVAPLVARWSSRPVIEQRVRRTLLALCVIYFWLCYTLIAMARLWGPHREDGFYAISLSLMLSVLLVRIADRVLRRPAIDTLR